MQTYFLSLPYPVLVRSRLLNLPVIIAASCAVFPFHAAYAVLDSDGNGLSDVWQKKYKVAAIVGSADADGDGFTNAQEAKFGTDPMNAESHPYAEFQKTGPANLRAQWQSEMGKIYTLQSSSDLQTWKTERTSLGSGGAMADDAAGQAGQPLFVRIGADDVDSDGDGVSDWEEILARFNPQRTYSEGLGSTSTNNPITDRQRLAAMLSATTNTISVAASDVSAAENWPDPARFVIRRTGNLDRLNLSYSLSGTATRNLDYTAPSNLVIPFGADEISFEITPLTDSLTEPDETVELQITAGTGYGVSAASSASVTIHDSSSGLPSEKAARRFLTQATFGASPTETASVSALGYAPWIDAQFQRPLNLHLPIVHAWQSELMPPSNVALVSTEHRMEAFWRQSMRSGSDADPLRQRTAFALSQIFVISDRMEALRSDQRGMANYYDTLLTHSFGNYRNLLEAVTRHPWMGVYLSAMRNRKADPLKNRFPDENYAREVLQLFSIGLWLLNPDGSHVISNGQTLGPDGETIPAGQSIPTYGQTQIAEIARVFTGLSYGTRFVSSTDPAEIPTTRFYDSNNVSWQPMRMFDGEHDLAPKSISFPGMSTLSLPARTAASSISQAAGDADLAAFLDHLSSHPNVGPFLSRLLIQRLVTSNPSPAYIGRVSAKFSNNGSGVRGDMKAVVRAILLDPEARDYLQSVMPSHGLVREPYVRFLAMARAFEAAPALGDRYRGFGSLDGDFLQRPLSAPSVFNFYSPENKPAGPLRDAGLNSPEMQIINSVTSITGPNRYSSALRVTDTTINTSTIPTNAGWTQLNPTSQTDDPATPENENLWNTRINEQNWLDLADTDPVALAPDAMVAKLDEVLCFGRMQPTTFRAITRALQRLSDPLGTADPVVRDQRIRARLRTAIHLVTTSADYSVLK